MMKKVLIVSLKAGAGHIKAAEAIEKAYKLAHPDYEIRYIDLLDYATILSKKFYGEWYMDLATKVPEFYKWFYENLDVSSKNIRVLSDRMNAQKFQKLVYSYEPDIIVCTHFVPANLLTVWREDENLKYKIAVTLTDYEAHSLWVDKKADLYSTANEEVKDQLTSLGINSEIIYPIGIPIDPKFSHSFNKIQIRQQFGLGDIFTIGIFAGAFGVGPMIEIFGKVIGLKGKFQIIAIAGKNEELKNNLDKIARKHNLKAKIFGFVENMEEIMAASDIIISKAGGLTVSESLAIGVPLIISNPFPGQEEANSNFLTENIAAFRSDNAKGIAQLLSRILENDKILDYLKESIKKIAKPDAAKEIVKAIESGLN